MKDQYMFEHKNKRDAMLAALRALNAQLLLATDFGDIKDESAIKEFKDVERALNSNVELSDEYITDRLHQSAIDYNHYCYTRGA